MKKSFFMMTVALATLTSVFFSCNKEKEETTPIAVSGITLSDTVKTLAPGETFTLTATLKPNDATDKKVNWTSSKPTVATVSATGVITAVAEGQTTISAVAGGFVAQAVITVKVPVAEGVTVTFKGETWVAQAVDAITNGQAFGIIAVKDPAEDFPFVIFYGNLAPGTYTLEEASDFFDFYHSNYIPAEEDGRFGDWWVKSGSITVTAYNTSTKEITGELNAILFNAYDYVVNENNNPEQSPIVIKFQNVTLRMASSAPATAATPAWKAPLQLNRFDVPKAKIIKK